MGRGRVLAVLDLSASAAHSIAGLSTEDKAERMEGESWSFIEHLGGLWQTALGQGAEVFLS